MFSDLLKNLRNKTGTTQSQLARAVGVSPGNVGDWETGKSKPGYVAIAALARYFEVSADYLLELSLEKSSAQNLVCDGLPLTESEADLVAMFRLLEEGDRKTIFDLTKLKYEQTCGGKASIYSTYSDISSLQKSAPDSSNEAASGNA